MELLDFGKPPVICEVIEAEIAIQTDRKDLKVWAVGPEATFVGSVPATFEEGWMRFRIGQKNPSIYYLIQAE